MYKNKYFISLFKNSWMIAKWYDSLHSKKINEVYANFALHKVEADPARLSQPTPKSDHVHVIDVQTVYEVAKIFAELFALAWLVIS